MKKIKIIILLLIFTVSVNAAPYFNMILDQAESIESRNNLSYMASILMDMGYLFSVTDKNGILALYELNYSGPGIKGSDIEYLGERSINHNVILKHIHKSGKLLDIKSKIEYINQMHRISIKREWGDGLYNNHLVGGGVELVFHLKKNILLTGKYRLNYNIIPNFTDLTTAYFSDDYDFSSNNNIFQYLGAILNYTPLEKLFFDASYGLVMRNYHAARTRTQNEANDGPKQYDMYNKFSVALKYTPSKMAVGANVKLDLKDSNQNYFESIEISSNANQFFFMNDYYDFISLGVTPYYIVMPSNKVNIVFIAAYFIKKFFNEHWIQNNDGIGTYKINENHWHSSIMLSVEFKFMPSDRFEITPKYVYKNLFSNNKYVRGYSYNYSIHQVGLTMSYKY